MLHSYKNNYAEMQRFKLFWPISIFDFPKRADPMIQVLISFVKKKKKEKKKRISLTISIQ